MKTIKHLSIILSVILFFAVARPVYAAQSATTDATQPTSSDAIPIDNRANILRAFLHEYDSPLEAEAGTFVREADKNSIDWKLVAAIAGTESTFGKNIPSYSYNAWGWGIPTGAQSGVGFTSWNDGITTVSQGLKENYIDKGATTLDQIGEIYAASPMWATHVQFFIEKIDQFAASDPTNLTVTI